MLLQLRKSLRRWRWLLFERWSSQRSVWSVFGRVEEGGRDGGLFACGDDGVHFVGQEEQICGRDSGEEGLEPVLVFSPYHRRHGSGIDLVLFFFSSNCFVCFFLLLFSSHLFQVCVFFLFYLEKETILFLYLLFFLMWKIELRSIHSRFPFVFWDQKSLCCSFLDLSLLLWGSVSSRSNCFHAVFQAHFSSVVAQEL